MSVNSEICKARSMFITRGILNRKIVPDIIVYSWVRSKLHNISFELLNVQKSQNSIDILSLDILSSSIIKYLRTVASEDSMIYVINSLGDVIYNNNFINTELPLFTNLSEESIGTNAAGVSLVSGKSLTVNGCEHYNKLLTKYISTSIVIESNVAEKNIIVAIFTPNRLRSSHERLHDILTDHFNKDEKDSGELSSPKDDSSKAKVEQVIKNLDNANLTSDIGHVSEKMSDESLNDANKDASVEKKTHVNTLKTLDLPPVVVEDEFHEEYGILNACKVFTLSVVEEKTIREALDYYHWNLKKTSEALGIGRSTLYRKLKEYSIEK